MLAKGCHWRFVGQVSASLQSSLNRNAPIIRPRFPQLCLAIPSNSPPSSIPHRSPKVARRQGLFDLFACHIELPFFPMVQSSTAFAASQELFSPRLDFVRRVDGQRMVGEKGERRGIVSGQGRFAACRVNVGYDRSGKRLGGTSRQRRGPSVRGIPIIPQSSLVIYFFF